MNRAVTSWLQTLDTNFYTRIQALVPQKDSWLQVSVTTWRLDAYHLTLAIHICIEVRIKFLASDCLLPNFLKLPSKCACVCVRSQVTVYFVSLHLMYGAWGSVVVKALRY
jgi:hypothetical protein